MTPVSVIGIPVYNGDQQYIEIYCQMYDSPIKLAPECFFWLLHIQMQQFSNVLFTES